MGGACLRLVVFLVAVAPPHVLAADHVVGGSIWSIPPRADLYSAWASNRTFVAGDNLVFRFETGMYNVVQVGRREYDDCTADDPYRDWSTGPAVVRLDSAAVRYFICTVGNYCSLGVKVYVASQNAP
uniref:Phytocyanin domain-containing protein n=1 Tax=Oryza punctata TaxID=4537 RepID=A0A0E0KGV6_ORYPU